MIIYTRLPSEVYAGSSLNYRMVTKSFSAAKRNFSAIEWLSVPYQSQEWGCFLAHVRSSATIVATKLNESPLGSLLIERIEDTCGHHLSRTIAVL